MNWLKSIFISAAIGFWMAATVFLLWNAWMHGIGITTMGLFFAGVVPLGYFVYLMGWKPLARTSKGLPLMTLSVLVGAVVLALSSGGSWLVAAGLASLMLWLAYTFWYSRLPPPGEKLKAKDRLPDLSLFNNGEEVRLSSFKGSPTLFLFYRGNWCPLCMAQIKEIAAAYKELTKLAEVVLVSPQPETYSRQLAAKFNLPFHFLTDRHNAVAQQLGIEHKDGLPMGLQLYGYATDTVLPIVIIVDSQLVIQYISHTDNYRIRPEPTTFLSILKEIEA